MSSETTNQPELTCQWCGGTIPENQSTCARCGAARPREDLVAPGYHAPPDEPSTAYEIDEPDAAEDPDDEARARKILKDLDVYVADKSPSPRQTTAAGPPSDEIPMILGILTVSAVVGGLLGWLLAPPLLHNVFNDMIGVDTDGPEAFRRLGAFLGALVGLLFGALAGTTMRR